MQARLGRNPQEAYGSVHLKPKHHYLHHNAARASEAGILLDCWVHERKHQMLKQATPGLDHGESVQDAQALFFSPPVGENHTFV